MLLPLDLLHSFQAVMTLGSFSRAGESLGRTQAAVENGLGVTALSQHSLPPQLEEMAGGRPELPSLEAVEIGLFCHRETGYPRALRTLAERFERALDNRLA